MARTTYLRLLARTSAALAVVIGATALAGWWLDVRWVRAPLRAFAPLPASSGLACALSGVALLLLVPGRASRRATMAAKTSAGAALALAVAVLAGLILGYGGRVDRLLAAESPPGALRSASSYLFIDVALLAFDRRTRRGWRPAELFALVAIGTACVAFLGFLFGSPALRGAYSQVPDTGMSLYAAISIVALGAGVLAARPEAGLMAVVTSAEVGGVLARRMLLLLLAFFPVVIAVALGADAGWYPMAEAAGLLVFLGLVATAAVTLLTAYRLNVESRAKRAAQESLARSEAELRSLVAQAADGIFIADLDGRYTNVNDAGCRMFGYAPDELVGKTIMDLIREEDASRLAHDREVLLAGGTTSGEWRMRRKDGSWIDVEVNAKILPDGRWQGFARDVTERKRIERALRELQADLERAQEVAHVGSWRLDVRKNELRWSAEAYRIFGVPVGTSLTYETFLGRVHPDDRAYVDRKWSAALRGEPYDIEHRIRVQDEVRWVREKAALDFDAAGELLGGVGITQDITDAKASRAALDRAHEQERQLREQLEALLAASVAMSDALVSLPELGLRAALGTIALQAQDLTRAEYAALGLGDDPARPFDPWIVVGGTDAEPLAARRELRSVLGAPIRYKGRTSGSLYIANKRGAEAFNEEDQRVLVALAGRAGSTIETARLYDSVALQRLWLETLFEQMPEAVVITDERGRVLHQSRSAEALERDAGRLDPWGNPLTYDMRRPSGAPLPADELPAYRAIAHGEHVAGAELSVISPDGELVPILASATPFRTKGGQTGAIMVFRDIRAIKELERLREEWTSVVAHDLRQPVSTISYGGRALASLCKARLPEKEQRIIASIQRASASLERMISDLLDISRIEARRLSVERRMVDLRELVERVVASTRATTEGFEVRVAASGEQPAFVDPDRIEQVLANLLSNAAKYGDRGAAILIEVSSHEDRVEVAVTNHGPGISAEELPHLFGRFARTERARESGVPGTGLGLYIAKGLVEAHGGHISVESTPGERTTFRLTIPRVEAGSALERVAERPPR